MSLRPFPSDWLRLLPCCHNHCDDNQGLSQNQHNNAIYIELRYDFSSPEELARIAQWDGLVDIGVGPSG